MNSLLRLSVIIETIDKLTGPVGKMIRSVKDLEAMTAKGKAISDYGQKTVLTGMMINEAAIKTKQVTADLLAPAVEMQDSLTALRTVTTSTLGSIDKSLELAKNKALAWSKVHADTAKEYVDNMYIMAGANLNDIQSIAGVETGLRVAKATMADAAATTNLLATSYINFGDKTKSATDEMNRLGDILTKTQQLFKIKNLDQLTDGLRDGSVAALNSRMSFAELNTVLGQLNNAGLEGGMAGTALKTSMSKLLPASKALGFTIAKNAEGGITFIGTLENIRKKFGPLSQLTDDMKMKFQKAFGGEEALQAVSLLIDKTNEMNKALNQIANSAGAAGEIQKQMESSSSQQYQIMQNNINAVKIAIGSKLLPELNKLMPSIIKIVVGFGKLAETHPRFTRTIFLLLALGAGALAIIAPILTVGGAFMTVLGSGMQATGRIGTALLKLGPIAKSAGETLYLRFLYAKDGINSAGMAVSQFSGRIINLGKGAIIQSIGTIRRLGLAVFTFGRQALVTAVTALPPLIAQAWAFTAALLANPITWIIAGVLALCVALYFLIKHWDKVKAATISVWNKVVHFTKVAFAYLKGIFTRFGPTILATLFPGLGLAIGLFMKLRKTFKTSGSALLDAFTDGLKSMLLKPYNILKGGLARIRRLLPHSDAKEGPLSTLTKSGGALVNTFGNGMVRKLPGLKNSLASGLAAMSLVIPTPGMDNPTLDSNYTSSIVGIEQSETQSKIFTKAGSKKKEIHIHGGVHIHVEKMDSVEDFFKVIQSLADEIGGDEEANE